jgi:1-phosphofructokinase family hexose kinase
MTIVCVTPNPAIDRTLVAPGWHVGEVQRPAHVIVAAGGKGLNVARTIRTLGGDPLCLGPLGGHQGRWLADLAQREGLRSSWTWTSSETRTCTIILDPSTGTSTGLYETGEPLAPEEWRRLSEDAQRECAVAEYVGFSGSLPPGVSTSDFGDLLHALSATGRSVWVDTSGAALEIASQIAGLSLKVNAAEIGALLQCEIASLDAARQAAREVRRRGAATIIVTLGQAGAVLSADAGTWHAAPPVIQSVNATGSGDAFLGGWLLALAEQCAMPEALRRAVAAGAANALSTSGGRFQRSVYEQIMAEVTVRRLSEI